jgi:SET domain
LLSSSTSSSPAAPATRSDAQDTGDSSNREIVATQFVAKGALLVRLPIQLALGCNRRAKAKQRRGSKNETGGGAGGTGPNISARDDGDNSSSDGPFGSVAATSSPAVPQQGSPWLECLIELYRAQQQLQQQQQQQTGHYDDSGAAGTVASSSTTSIAWKPYVDSLPAKYDTLLDWKDGHLTFLAGTSSGEECGGSHEQQLQVLRHRYLSNVRPRLVERNVLSTKAHEDADAEFKRFLVACQAISTRCFHHHLDDDGDDDDDDDEDALLSSITRRMSPVGDGDAGTLGSSFGPCFLPVMDLLNHCSDEDTKVTTLTAVKRRDAHIDDETDGVDEAKDDIVCFEMRAERDVRAGEPVTHSYFGQSPMTSEQCLRTFGFVERSAVQRAFDDDAASASIAESATSAVRTTSHSSSLTPAVVSKEMVLKCCQRTVQKERQDREIARVVGARQSSCEGGDDDDDPTVTWDLPTPDAFLLRDVSSLPEHFVVTASNPLSDDLVTLLCLPFLPNDAYEELRIEPSSAASSSPPSPQSALATLDPTVLEDPYLGQLVGRTLLDLVEEKAGTYEAIRIGGIVADRDDRALLQELLHVEAGHCNAVDDDQGTPTSVASILRAMDATSRQRLAYGLTIRLEEQMSLAALRRAAIRILLGPPGYGDGGDDDNRKGIKPPGAKRQRNTSA